jgi:MscS family membrane protein
LVAVAVGCVLSRPAVVQAQVPETAAPETGNPMATIRTESPRATLESFLRLRDRLETETLAYLSEPTRAGAATLVVLSDQLNSLIDLEAVPPAARRETGVRTYSMLMDIFGRIGAPDLMDLPDLDQIEESGQGYFRIPQTPFRLVRLSEGGRTGEFLFDPSTVQIAPWFLETVRDQPLETRLPTESITTFGKQLTGPLIPPSLIEIIPPPLKGLWLDTPIWKVWSMLGLLAILGGLLAGLHRAFAALRPSSPALAKLSSAIVPVAILATTTAVLPFVSGELNVSGRFANALGTAATLVTHLALAWLVWLGARLAGEWLLLPAGRPRDSLDADMLRLLFSTLGVVGAVILLARGGQAIGLPVVSVLAGLGIGGLAVALAVRPTLENLIGGIILYVDRPVSVGDFCTFGDQMGTVESVGVRSTKLRALDRTLISVPNAQFADMQIINWAQCDEMLINETLGLRYETTVDQLRFVLAELRRMLHAHPRINSKTVRVRFWGYGMSEIKVNVRVYATTREWNDFFAIREDVYFRIFEIVKQAGTDFALQSQTLFLGRDHGIDIDKGRRAEREVESWRRSGTLPFPRLRPEELEEIDGTLDYPPRGSHEAGAENLDAITGAERLSVQQPDGAESPHENPDREETGTRRNENHDQRH